MKKKLTVTIEESLIRRAKRYARRYGLSVSSVVEDALRRLTDADDHGFVERWRGAFAAVEEDNGRRRALAEKYL